LPVGGGSLCPSYLHHHPHTKLMAGINEEKLNLALATPAADRSDKEKQLVLVHFSHLCSQHGKNAMLCPPHIPPLLWPHIVEWERNPAGTPFWVRVVNDGVHPYFDPSNLNIALMFKLLASPDPKVFPAKPHPLRKLVLTQFRFCAFANKVAEFWKVLDPSGSSPSGA
jgi:hypothetical protein